jgi:DNA repair photolyase
MQTPLVISASRATDIPAFYSAWFFNALRRGYVVWANPFNGKRLFVSLRAARTFVFWSKNPAPMLDRLGELEDLGRANYYFQFTLNDYEREGLEPNLPPLADRIAIFERLSKRVGAARVIWRFDPIVNLPPDEILRRAETIGDRVCGLTEKLVFSFVDSYAKVRRNLPREFLEPDENARFRIAENLARLGEKWRIKVAACAEKDDFSRFGIARNACVDSELIARIGGAEALRLGKDRGQRDLCGCAESKDIGAYNTCRHLCRYCYANSSANAVSRNAALHDENGESLIAAR